MKLTDLLIVVGFIAILLFLSPCSPFCIWKSGSFAWKPKVKPPLPLDHTTSKKL